MSSATDAQPSLTDDLETFLDRYCEDDVAQLAQDYPHDASALRVPWGDLLRFEPDIAEDYLTAPRTIQEHLDDALAKYDLPVDVDLSGATVRVTDLPEEEIKNVDETRSRDIGRYLGIYGQVGKVSDVKPYPETAVYTCQRCGTQTGVPNDGSDVQEPHECTGCERQGPFVLDQEASTLIDRQVIRIQQPPEQAAGDRSERTEVFVEDGLAGEVTPGDRLNVYGTYHIQGDDLDDISHGLDTAVEGRALDIEETDYDEIAVDEHREQVEAIAAGDHGDPFDLLVGSIAPKHHGDEDIKLAIGLQLFGGSRVEYPDGSIDRGDSHILLMGDPGGGKSSLLRAVEELAPRSVYASGKGASAAGMTAAAVPDDFGDTKWSIKAGAMVLANKGVACVDEIDKIDEDAISSLHDALESQRVEVNKADINATMPARTALLAAGNPEYGRFDPHEPFAQQIDLGPTLLSRFDLLFMVTDQPDREADTEVAEKMIEGRAAASAAASDAHEVSEEQLDEIRPAIDPEVLRAYIALAKQEYDPVIRDDDVKQRLRDFFVELRLANGEGIDTPVPTTFRKLEAIERLAEASARIRLSNEVAMADVERAAHLVQSSMRDVGIDPDSGSMDVDVVETGMSQSQRDRMEIVDATLRDACSDGPADVEDVFDALADEGVARTKAKHALNKLLDRGEAWCTPSTDLDEAERIMHTEA